MNLEPRRIIGAAIMAIGMAVGLAGLGGLGPRDWMLAGAGVLVIAGGGLFADPRRGGGDLGVD